MDIPCRDELNAIAEEVSGQKWENTWMELGWEMLEEAEEYHIIRAIQSLKYAVWMIERGCPIPEWLHLGIMHTGECKHPIAGPYMEYYVKVVNNGD